MRAKMLLDGGRPKVDPKELRKTIEGAGLKVTDGKADVGIVVGGDGIFGMYGRIESIPLLFVGVKSGRAAGSKAFLASAYFDELPSVLKKLESGDFTVAEHKRLEVFKNGKSLGEVFTDVYLQRGAESNCIRYRVRVSGAGMGIEETAVGDGVVVSTAAGSTGYYSYPDRIRELSIDPAANTKIGEQEIGICHITPTYSERSGSAEHPLRYTVPWGSKVELSLFRPADARLYGTEVSRSGVKVSTTDSVTILPSRNGTRVVSVNNE